MSRARRATTANEPFRLPPRNAVLVLRAPDGGACAKLEIAHDLPIDVVRALLIRWADRAYYDAADLSELACTLSVDDLCGRAAGPVRRPQR